MLATAIQNRLRDVGLPNYGETVDLHSGNTMDQRVKWATVDRQQQLAGDPGSAWGASRLAMDLVFTAAQLCRTDPITLEFSMTLNTSWGL